MTRPAFSTANPESPGHALPALGLVFASALLIRVLHIAALHDSPFFDFTIGDATAYDAWGRRIAAGNWLGDEVFYQAPLYPYFLGFVYTIFGHDFVWLRLTQAVLGASACTALARAGWLLFGRSAGLATGLILAFYAPAIFFDGLIQKSVLDLFLLSLVLWLLAGRLTRSQRPGHGAWFATGLAMGALILTRENAVALAVVLAGWTAARRPPPPRRKALAATAALLAGMGCVLGPVAARNTVVGGGFYLTTSQLGTNLYIGNHAEATGSYVPLRRGRGSARFERDDATSLAETAVGRRLTPAEVSSYWTRRAVDWAVQNPSDWLSLMFRKFKLLWDSVELVDSEDQYTVADVSPPLRAAGLINHFGVLLPLSALGLVATWRDRRRLTILYLLLATYASSVLLFYVFARYRYPLVPFLALFAGAGVAHGWRWTRDAPVPGRVGCAALVLAAALLSNLGTSPTGPMRAVTYHNLANDYRARGDEKTAIDHYRHAIELADGFSEAHDALAATYLSLGRNAEAEQQYRYNLERNPGDALAHHGLAKLLGASERLEEAEVHYRRAVALDPHSPDAHYDYGVLLASRGRWIEAVEQLETTLALEPDRPELRGRLGLALRRAGRSDDALEHLLEALETAPESISLLRSAAWVLATHPDASLRNGELAVRLAVRAAAAPGGEHPRTLDVLAAAYAESGRFELARKTVERAIARSEGARLGTLRARRDIYTRNEAFRSRADGAEPRRAAPSDSLGDVP